MQRILRFFEETNFFTNPIFPYLIDPLLQKQAIQTIHYIKYQNFKEGGGGKDAIR